MRSQQDILNQSVLELRYDSRFGRGSVAFSVPFVAAMCRLLKLETDQRRRRRLYKNAGPGDPCYDGKK